MKKRSLAFLALLSAGSMNLANTAQGACSSLFRADQPSVGSLQPSKETAFHEIIEVEGVPATKYLVLSKPMEGFVGRRPSKGFQILGRIFERHPKVLERFGIDFQYLKPDSVWTAYSDYLVTLPSTEKLNQAIETVFGKGKLRAVDYSANDSRPREEWRFLSERKIGVVVDHRSWINSWVRALLIQALPEKVIAQTIEILNSIKRMDGSGQLTSGRKEKLREEGQALLESLFAFMNFILESNQFSERHTVSELRSSIWTQFSWLTFTPRKMVSNLSGLSQSNLRTVSTKKLVRTADFPSLTQELVDNLNKMGFSVH